MRWTKGKHTLPVVQVNGEARIDYATLEAVLVEDGWRVGDDFIPEPQGFGAVVRVTHTAEFTEDSSEMEGDPTVIFTLVRIYLGKRFWRPEPDEAEDLLDWAAMLEDAEKVELLFPGVEVRGGE